MSAAPDTILFEVVSTPPSSFSPGGYRVLAALLCVAAALPAILFTVMGAWPVLGFLGIEVPLVLLLVARQARGSRRVREALVLTPGGLTVTRTDHRGLPRRQCAEIAATNRDERIHFKDKLRPREREFDARCVLRISDEKIRDAHRE